MGYNHLLMKQVVSGIVSGGEGQVLSDLDAGACIFEENESIETINNHWKHTEQATIWY